MQRRSIQRAFVLFAATALCACGSGTESEGGASDTGGDGAAETTERPFSDAVALYNGGTQPTCQTCHGANGQGAMMGPSIDALGEMWEVESLTAFLVDPPAAMAESERLTELAGRYPMPMPKPSGFTDSDARVLARWLLEGMPKE